MSTMNHRTGRNNYFFGMHHNNNKLVETKHRGVSHKIKNNIIFVTSMIGIENKTMDVMSKCLFETTRLFNNRELIIAS